MKILKIVWKALKIALGLLFIGGGILNLGELTKSTSGIEALEYLLAIALSFLIGYYLLKSKKKIKDTEANNALTTMPPNPNPQEPTQGGTA